MAANFCYLSFILKIKQNKTSETNFCRFFFLVFNISSFIYVVKQQFLSKSRKKKSYM